jgi:hypothetical protein
LKVINIRPFALCTSLQEAFLFGHVWKFPSLSSGQRIWDKGVVLNTTFVSFLIPSLGET